jgi:hypothetical protein
MRAASVFQLLKRSRTLERSLDRQGAVDIKRGPLSDVRGSVLGIALLLLASLPALAAVDGTVINKTSGKPAAGVTVRLTSLGQDGMKPLGRTETAANGSFRFDTPAEGHVPGAGQLAGRAVHPEPAAQCAQKRRCRWSSTTSGRSSMRPSLTQHIVFLESDGQQLVASEMIIYRERRRRLTWYDAKRAPRASSCPRA